MTNIDADTFRSLLGSFATGITVVTLTDAANQPVGMTVSAVAAVSLDPPLVLMCIGKGASNHPHIAGAEHFAINVLAADQQDLSDRFATEAPDRFAGVPHRADNGPPLLDGVAAHIVCTTWETVDAGDHTIVIGVVTGGAAHDRPPLLHFRGTYRSVH